MKTRLFIVFLNFGLLAALAAQNTNFPEMKIPGIELGMTEDSLKHSVPDVSISRTSSKRDIGVVQQGAFNAIFYFREGRLVRFAYGWEGEGSQEKLTQTILNGYQSLYGVPQTIQRKRIDAKGSLEIAAKQFNLKSGGITASAVVESWNNSLWTTVSDLEATRAEDAAALKEADKRIAERLKDDKDFKRNAGLVRDFLSGEKGATQPSVPTSGPPSTTATSTPQPSATATPTAATEKSGTTGFPIVPVVILAAVIAGAAVFFLRRKS